ncbi:MAG: glycosyltransferase [Flavobacteriales bacterium]|nr:glycosyltransferase [Flavobacteriales bacterium]MDW8409305.1 glycosyltransferase [Flavobacteriales bacterium]
MKVAFVHDWYLQKGGSEEVAGEIYRVLRPLKPHIYAMLGSRSMAAQVLNSPSPQLHTSWMARLPFAAHFYKIWLPVFPLAMAQLPLHRYDVVVSSSHAAAKNIRKKKGALHICYCHTPSRYLWAFEKEYLQDYGLYRPLFLKVISRTLTRLRKWDLQGSHTVDYFIANSHYVAGRIKEFYKKEATVIYPPVDTDFFQLPSNKNYQDGYYFTSSRDVPYKKLDLILWTFNQMPSRPLVMATRPAAIPKLQKQAAPHIRVVPMGSREEYRQWLHGAKAYVFAALDDFGIAPVEAMACGVPVIALAAGGALETVQEGKNGIFFHRQTVKSLMEAVERFEGITSWDASEIRASVLKFSRQRFEKEIRNFFCQHFPEPLAAAL